MKYTCDKCDCKSKWKGYLKKHIESVHGDVGGGGDVRSPLSHI